MECAQCGTSVHYHNPYMGGSSSTVAYRCMGKHCGKIWCGKCATDAALKRAGMEGIRDQRCPACNAPIVLAEEIKEPGYVGSMFAGVLLVCFLYGVLIFRFVPEDFQMTGFGIAAAVGVVCGIVIKKMK